MATTAPRKNRLGTLSVFVLLVVIGRQFTPHSSSAATETAAPTLASVLSDGPVAPEHYFVERIPCDGPPLYRVRASDGRIVADGLGSAQLTYHFPQLRPVVGSGPLAGP